MTDEVKKGFCILPFMHMEIQIDGGVYTCCHSTDFTQLGNLHQESLKDIWEGDKWQNTQNEFLNGDPKKIDHCKDCFYFEELGLESWRQSENSSWQHHIDAALKGEIKTPKSVAIRISNLCNFSCRMCKPSASTGWFSDAKFLNPKGKYQIVESTPSHTSILEQLEPFIDGLEHIQFVGGEPLMEKDHYLILEAMLERNPNIEITYDTNLSFLGLKDWDVLKLWRGFKKINLSGSIDGFGPQGEYIRKGLDWPLFLENWNKVRAEVPNAQMMMTFTLSIYNMFHVLDFIDEVIRLDLFKGHNPMNLMLSLVEEPRWQCLQALPQEVKKVVTDRYRNYPHRSFGKIAHELDDAIRFMNGRDQSSLMSVFKSFNKKLDLIRNENFEDIFPEEAKLLGI